MYVGNYVSGRKHGKGFINYKNGDSYNGDFQNGVKSG